MTKRTERDFKITLIKMLTNLASKTDKIDEEIQDFSRNMKTIR